MKRKSAIKYERAYKPRAHTDSSFRHLAFDDENNATVSTVLGINHELKCGASEVLRLMARTYTAQTNPRLGAYLNRYVG
jgi:hypothetical protein